MNHSKRNIHFDAGAKDEALEASAERLFQHSRASSVGSGGYSSDSEVSPSTTHDIEASSISSHELSFATSSFSSVLDESSDADVESEIIFIQEKQNILKRAIDAMNREEAYDASCSREILAEHTDKKESRLWQQARDMLELLSPSDDTTNERERAYNPSSTKEKRPFKKSRIDSSSVTCISSSEIQKDSLSTDLFETPKALSIPFEVEGPWMGEALAASFSNVDNNTKTSNLKAWNVVNDPDLGPLVIPPCSQSFSDGVELRDALGLTLTAQLVTMSTPPFCVVHANRAFSSMSGLSSDEIIGKPVESLLWVKKISSNNTVLKTKSGFLCSSMLPSGKSCVLDLLPVKDTFRNPRGGMSHLLIKINPGSILNNSIENVASSILAKTLETEVHNNQVFGTVG